MASSTQPAGASTRAGEFIVAHSGPDGYATFRPRPLPPDPPLEIDSRTQRLQDEANQALGRLDGITLLLPDPDQFLYTYIRKEAVLSSQIEGTQSSLSDLLLFENEAAPGVPALDTQEPVNYIAALNHGMEAIASGRLPLCNRLLKEVHAILLRTGRGSDKSPGEFRRDQNWIGGSKPAKARFVPPSSTDVVPAMSDLEKFLHDDPVVTPVLVKAALAHAQFETIHPFYDGNGRIGRMLITLLLYSAGVLRGPLLYLSLFLKDNRDAYYDHLQRIRTEGAWEDWLEFFLTGVVQTARSTTDTTRQIVSIVDRDRARIQTLGRGAATASRVYERAARVVVLRAPRVARELNMSEPPVYRALERLEDLGILEEITGRPRRRIWVYREYLDLLNEGTTSPGA